MPLSGAAAMAAQISRTGDVVYVSGSIGLGDDAAFDRIAPSGSYKTVMLSSPGAGEGGLPSAVAMARKIRAAGATTVVNASQGLCGSACTLMFAAGSRRIYLGGDRIAEGVRSKGQRGLGFHQARSNNGTALMASVYSELGASAGADFSRRSPFETFYYVSGASALSSGIATSLK